MYCKATKKRLFNENVTKKRFLNFNFDVYI